MRKHGHNETIYFNGFGGYYGLMSAHDGYGGFNYLDDVLYMSQSNWTQPGGAGYQYHWCDTGYQNVAAAAHSTSIGWIYDYGLIESASSQPFTLHSMIAAASWSKDAVWNVISYTEKNGSLILKASDEITVSFSKAETINFAKLGHKGDFTNIAAVAFELVSLGQPGNTCTYGTGEEGYQLVFDMVKCHLGRIRRPDGANSGGSPLPHTHHVIVAHPQASAAASISAHSVTSEQSGHATGHGPGDTYHSQLNALDNGHESGLTSQFSLPHVEMFGT
jgi:hypothetical protein